MGRGKEQREEQAESTLDTEPSVGLFHDPAWALIYWASVGMRAQGLSYVGTPNPTPGAQSHGHFSLLFQPK